MINVTDAIKYTGALLVGALLLGNVTAAIQEPQVLVKETTDKITSVLRAEQNKIKADPNRLLDIVDAIVAPHFDFERMSSWVLGKYWRKAKPEEKARFAQEFRTLLVRTYAKALNDNYDKQIDMLPSRKRKDGKQVTVRTEIQQSGGFPIPISYKMHIKDGVWKVFDVSVDGISLVANYRSSFAKEIRKDGLEKLIARLADRNQPAKAADTAK
ncbi:MAG TPA: ABC transporter substrate-binding protein [Gammaproteobacteria bacterium]|nr:ABC transporter substrate-binding protein [Gammaproteobacteria bacterium]